MSPPSISLLVVVVLGLSLPGCWSKPVDALPASCLEEGVASQHDAATPPPQHISPLHASRHQSGETENETTGDATRRSGDDHEVKKRSVLCQVSSEDKVDTNHTVLAHSEHNTTSDDTAPPRNDTEAVDSLHQTELAPVENIAKAITGGNSAGLNYQNSSSAESASDLNTAADRYEHKILMDDAATHEESFVLESDSHIHTGSDSDEYKQENFVADEDDHQVRTPVRKCCDHLEFFSLQTQKCETAENGTWFREAVLSMLPEDTAGDLEYITGSLPPCPGTGDPPSITEISLDSHSVQNLGYVRDHTSGINYDHDHYCLEVAANGQYQLDAGAFVLASCLPWPTEVYTRKCCELDEYFDHEVEECRLRSANMSDHDSLVREFFKTNPKVTSIHVKTGRLSCSRGAPRLVTADNAFLDASNQLCEHQSGHCYPNAVYCLEHLWAEGDMTMTAVAFVCPLDSFHKCCSRDHVLTESGCVPASGKEVSAHMMQLLEIMEPQFGFPTEQGGEQCVTEWITPDDTDIRWLISKSGYLSIDTPEENYATMQYCVDDYVDPLNQTQTVALMCYTELDDIVPVHLSARPSEAGSVGKCCPHNQYMTMGSYTCVSDDLGVSLLHDRLVSAANITKLTYTSFPVCESGFGYHYYYLDPDALDDHGELVAGQMLEVVSLEGRCVLSRQHFPRESYCLEYGVHGPDIRPIVLVCPETWEGIDVHSEKFELTAVLLGLSCTALLATAFSLISTRVRRGLVTVKKVNTLAGRILLSYVMSYLVGFLLLAVNMKVEVAQDNVECHIMGERVSTSEGWRYVYHSAWAWGVPGMITALSLILDYHRYSLPCGVITPKVGLYKCFFSDRTAKLVYLYVPMLLSLCANIVLLAVARYVSQDPHSTTSKDSDDNGNNNNSSQHQPATTQASGLRTHQTRNLWIESVKLVVWSGATWLMEVIGFVVAQYIITPSESWYDYLWYLPSCINSLRGVGIFFILVLTPENRVKLKRALGNLGGSLYGLNSMSTNSRSVEANSSCGNHQSSVGGSEVRGPGRRNMSVATTITQLSSIRSSHSTDSRADPAAGRATAHPGLAHSISQVDTRRSSASSASSEYEGLELDTEIGAGGRRKSSLANFGVVSLPSVDEEDVFEEATPIRIPLKVTQTSSDA
ncbi:G-protein coupled receptor Mth-like 1-like 3 [Homarus americanus]|uniref:G-protein coupled receptor Mth-like 1-like 3 n=1 Tax=Homarus americanus TaxID=6706 RepID=A0A8J5N571_HOMAM|nr:G-protein coupled receptor Mth-like 1-like 3 [Homarus americanus]